MGQAVSISRTKNDFELVIRATKELEWILETQFGAPDGKTVGLHDKISAARIPGSGQPLPEAVTRKRVLLRVGISTWSPSSACIWQISAADRSMACGMESGCRKGKM